MLHMPCICAILTLLRAGRCFAVEEGHGAGVLVGRAAEVRFEIAPVAVVWVLAFDVTASKAGTRLIK
jgi:hypothetical protein